MRRMPQARSTKAKARIDSFYDLEDKAHRKQQKEISAFDTAVRRIGGKVLEMNNVGKRFDEVVVLDDFTYTFKKGERIGVAGPNGVGKSSLLNLITGSLLPDQGRISKGQTIEFGYFSQEGLQPKGDPRVIEMVKEIAEVVPMGKGSVSASQFLSYFNFTHQNQYSYFSSLSGGEKRRLALLTVLVRNPNFLILDEPTNDLDIATLRVLEDYLLQYPGCLMIVSHDRFFLDKLVDHIFFFEANGKVKDFYGNYSEYRKWKRKQDALLSRNKSSEQNLEPVKPRSKTDSNKPTYKEVKEFEALTAEIESLEKEKQQLLEYLNSGSGTPEELQQWSQRFEAVSARLEECELRWLELDDKIHH
jgi:ATP-binding cassette subfamily F protein uup